MANRNSAIILNGAQYNEDNGKLKGKYLEYGCPASYSPYKPIRIAGIILMIAAKMKLTIFISSNVVNVTLNAPINRTDVQVRVKKHHILVT